MSLKKQQTSKFVSRLHSLNQLLAATAGSDPEITAQIRTALDFIHAMEQDTSSDRLQSITKVAEIHFSHRSDCTIACCDLTDTAADPLFMRYALLQAIRQLAGSARAVLILFGVASTLCPPGQRWGSRKRKQYDATVKFIEENIARMISPRLRLRLIIV